MLTTTKAPTVVPVPMGTFKQNEIVFVRYIANRAFDLLVTHGTPEMRVKYVELDESYPVIDERERASAYLWACVHFAVLRSRSGLSEDASDAFAVMTSDSGEPDPETAAARRLRRAKRLLTSLIFKSVLTPAMIEIDTRIVERLRSLHARHYTFPLKDIDNLHVHEQKNAILDQLAVFACFKHLIHMTPGHYLTMEHIDAVDRALNATEREFIGQKIKRNRDLLLRLVAAKCSNGENADPHIDIPVEIDGGF